MKLLVGLGNPDKEYEKNRHNIGFMVIDELVRHLKATPLSRKASFKGDLYKGGDILLLKPQTYMNLSGESVQAVSHFYGVELEDNVVIHDDLDLSFGALRVKKGGGHGGHNGLRTIDKHITPEYKRVRCGIGKPQTKQEIASYVLSNFTSEEFANLDKELMDAYAKASLALLSSSVESVASTMTRK